MCLFVFRYHTSHSESLEVTERMEVPVSALSVKLETLVVGLAAVDGDSAELCVGQPGSASDRMPLCPIAWCWSLHRAGRQNNSTAPLRRQPRRGDGARPATIPTRLGQRCHGSARLGSAQLCTARHGLPRCSPVLPRPRSPRRPRSPGGSRAPVPGPRSLIPGPGARDALVPSSLRAARLGVLRAGVGQGEAISQPRGPQKTSRCPRGTHPAPAGGPEPCGPGRDGGCEREPLPPKVQRAGGSAPGPALGARRASGRASSSLRAGVAPGRSRPGEATPRLQ